MVNQIRPAFELNDYKAGIADADSGRREHDPAQKLVDWAGALDGVQYALVVRLDGSIRVVSQPLTPEDQGMFPFLIEHAEDVTRPTSSRSSYAIELVSEDERKILVIKLKGGHLCALTERRVEIREMIDRVKSWRPRRTK